MKRMALTTDGRFTWCSSPDHLVGKRRCKHVAIQSKEVDENGDFIESIDDFKKRVDNMRKELKKMEIKNISKYDGFELDSNYFNERSTQQIINEYVHLQAINLRLKKALQPDPKFFFAKDIQEKDENMVKEALKAAYPKREKFNDLVEKWKYEHSDYYEDIPAQKTFKPSEEDKARAQLFVDELTDSDTRCYWYFKTKKMVDQYKKFMNGNENFMTTKKKLKDEYKDEWDAFQKSAYDESGWIGEAAVKETVTIMVPSKKYTQLRAIMLNISESELESDKRFSEILERHIELPDGENDDSTDEED